MPTGALAVPPIVLSGKQRLLWRIKAEDPSVAQGPRHAGALSSHEAARCAHWTFPTSLPGFHLPLITFLHRPQQCKQQGQKGEPRELPMCLLLGLGVSAPPWDGGVLGGDGPGTGAAMCMGVAEACSGACIWSQSHTDCKLLF